MKPVADTANRAETQETRWDRTCAELEHFVAERGRMPNSRYAPIEEIRLRNWISTQRSARLGLGTATLDVQRTRRLEAIAGWHR